MSDLIVNVRFGEWHFQIGRNRPRFRWSHSAWHADHRDDDDWTWFDIYQGGFWIGAAVGLLILLAIWAVL